jgi:uncharacterized membrane protein
MPSREHLRPIALIAIFVGAVGSAVLLLRAGPNAPMFLKVGFSLWVVSPFALLAVADRLVTRWSQATRTTLDVVTIVMALLSLVLYGVPALKPRGTPNTFMFVAVPPVSWLLLAIVFGVMAAVARRGPSR